MANWIHLVGQNVSLQNRSLTQTYTSEFGNLRRGRVSISIVIAFQSIYSYARTPRKQQSQRGLSSIAETTDQMMCKIPGISSNF